MLNGLSYWLLGIPALFVFVYAFRKRFRASRPYVIGEQMARAEQAEQQRLSKGNIGPSPLPVDLHYDNSWGEFGICDPEWIPLDLELSDLCHRFAAGGSAHRSELRSSASMDDFYTLILFSKRSAVFAMRDRKADHIRDGATAIAMIEHDRIDFRDVLGSLSLLYHAGQKIGANPASLFEKAASIAEPRMAKLILGFLNRSEEYKSIQKSWGYAVVETEGGPGFVGWNFESYNPTYPLDRVALALTNYLQSDRYRPTRVTLADRLPAVWLSSADNRTLESALKSVRAAVTINSRLHPQESVGHEHQTMTIFLVELSDEASAESLFELSEQKKNHCDDFVIAGAKYDRLFCLAVQRSFIADEGPVESTSTMQRISAGIVEVLKPYARK